MGKVMRMFSPGRFFDAQAEADSGESGWMRSPVLGSKPWARREKRSFR